MKGESLQTYDAFDPRRSYRRNKTLRAHTLVTTTVAFVCGESSLLQWRESASPLEGEDGSSCRCRFRCAAPHRSVESEQTGRYRPLFVMLSAAVDLHRAGLKLGLWVFAI